VACIASIGRTWAIVLAGGEGRRLHSLTTTSFGIAVPKQLAETLVAGGALWNTFIVIARASALIELFVEKYPDVVVRMRSAILKGSSSSELSPATIELYRELRDIDFSRHVLQGAEAQLGVVQASRCGWSDLGTPKRLARTLQSLAGSCEYCGDITDRPAGFLNLAVQHARHHTPGNSTVERTSAV
jgi:mannose-1-phosphate guanylyltransferase